MQQTEEQEGDKEKVAGAATSPTAKKDGTVKQDKGSVKKDPAVKTDKDHREMQKAKEAKIAENEAIRELKAQLKYIISFLLSINFYCVIIYLGKL